MRILNLNNMNGIIITNQDIGHNAYKIRRFTEEGKKLGISLSHYINDGSLVIDDTYEEIGKSGSIYNKKDVIQELNNLKEDRNIEIYNFKCNKISNNIYLVHYITKNNDKNIYRTSIWKEENNLKIIFHQASEYKENIELEKF